MIYTTVLTPEELPSSIKDAIVLHPNGDVVKDKNAYPIEFLIIQKSLNDAQDEWEHLLVILKKESEKEFGSYDLYITKRIENFDYVQPYYFNIFSALSVKQNDSN